jgi:BASS family bile acid:Na+ symporter
VVAPVVAAVALVAFLPIEPAAKAAIMLMAVSPVPPLVPGQELGIGGRKNYAYGLYVAMAVITIVSVPLMVALVATLFGKDVEAPVSTIAQTVFLGVLLPLAIGLSIRAMAPDFAKTASGWVFKLSMILVLLAFLPIVVKVWPVCMQMIGNGTLMAMALVTVIALAVGHNLGGPDLRDRATLAIASSVRHPGLALALAAANTQNQQVTAGVLLFMLVGLMVAFPYKAWIKRRMPPVKTPPPPNRAAHA